jgi:phosphatidylglycerol:prolipoprotein diacylglycerol transferase
MGQWLSIPMIAAGIAAVLWSKRQKSSDIDVSLRNNQQKSKKH